MGRQLRLGVSVMLWVCLPAAAAAQVTSGSGIAGVVKDTSGALLPGVTVEAASPSLIEKVRIAATDGQGQFKIVDLRPGTYTVTFSLSGFSTLKRENIELPSNFTATVNVDLSVGSLEETIMVSGQSPVVDVQNTATRTVLRQDTLDSLPSGSKTMQTFIALIPGLTQSATSQDVGGSKGEIHITPTIHGGRGGDSRTLLDGFETNLGMSGGASRVFYPNLGAIQEVNVELGNGGAEAPTGGVTFNYIPRDGGNDFRGNFFGAYTNESLQGTNLSDELIARGLNESSIGGIDYIWDAQAGVGGPIMRDRLWFFTSFRSWGNSNFVASNYFDTDPHDWVYTPDVSRRAIDDQENKVVTGRLTWQAAQKHRINLSFDWERRCWCHGLINGTTAPEAVTVRRNRPTVLLGSWSHPATSRLLFEGGIGYINVSQFIFNQPDIPADQIPVTELSSGVIYRAPLGNVNSPNVSVGPKLAKNVDGRVSAAYVTGSHAFKAGLQLRQMWLDLESGGSPIAYQFRNEAPTAVNLFAYPLTYPQRLKALLGLYAQDQWTVKRLTLNMGLRFEYQNAMVPVNDVPAGRWVAARSFPEVPCVPCWSDFSPRLSAAYDVFGTGRTAIKVTVGRFMASEILDLAASNTPVLTSVAQATRSWTDANRDLVPQESELGPLSDAGFGGTRITTRYSDELLRDNRPYNWQASAGLQHELRPGIAVNLGYFRSSWHTFRVTDNLRLTPADFDPFCVTVPVDARLPGGGGDQACGLYNLVPTKFGQADNLVTLASDFGEQSEVYNGVDATISARLPGGAFVQGGLSTGSTRTNSCFVVDSPQSLRFCEVNRPFSAATQFKLSGSYRLPWSFQASAAFQSLPGIPVTASYVATNAEVRPTLGRALSGSATTVTVDLIEPQTMFEERGNQIDMRFSRNFNVGRTRIQAQFDIYNVFNGSPILAINSRYGPAWRTPTAILEARFIKIGAQLNF